MGVICKRFLEANEMAKAKELSPREAAQRLGIRLDSLYALIWAGKLMAHKLDGRWRIRADAVEARLKTKKGGGNGQEHSAVA